MGLMTKLPPEKKSKLIGDVVLLAAASNIHREFPLKDIIEVLLPPLDLNQFRIYHNKGGRPIGLVTWAWVTSAVLERYRIGDVMLSQQDWKSGNILLITDFISPFGGARRIIAELREAVFPNDRAFAQRFNKIGVPKKKLSSLRGIDAPVKLNCGGCQDGGE